MKKLNKTMNESELKKNYVAVKERQEEQGSVGFVGDIDAEIEKLTVVVNSQKAESHHWNNLGCLHFEKENITEAEKSFQRALELDEHNLIAQQNLGDLFYYQRKYDCAIQNYRKISDRLENGDVLARMGDCYAGMGDLDAARSAYIAALEMKPQDESLLYRLGLFETAKTPSTLEMNLPLFNEDEIALICYFSGEGQKRSPHFSDNGLFALFEKLQNSKMQLSIFHDEEDAPNSAVFHFKVAEDFTALSHKYLFDVFLSVNDVDVFKSDISAVLRILCMDNLQNEMELNQVAALCFQGKLDALIIEEKIREKFSERAWQQFKHHQVVFSKFNRSLFQHVEELFLQQSMTHIDKFLLTDNPAKAKKILDKLISKYSDREPVKNKTEFFEAHYPHISDDVAYFNLYEDASKVSKFNEEIYQHACYVWMVDQLHRSKDVLNILDVGCHKGEYAINLANLGYQVTGLDISEYNIQFAETMTPQGYTDINQVEWVRGKAEKLSHYFYPNQFDAVMLFQIMNHVQDFSLVLNQVERIVKPEGQVLITVNADSFENVRNELIHEENFIGKKLRKFSREELQRIFGDQHRLEIDEINDGKSRWFGISFRLAVPKDVLQKVSAGQIDGKKTRLDNMFQSGYEYASNGHFEKAFQEYMNIAEYFPEQGRALYNAGIISDLMGERDSAILLLNKVCEIFPDMIESFNYLGKIYFQEEDYKEAFLQFKKAFSLDRSSEAALENLKMTANKLGVDFDENEFGD